MTVITSTPVNTFFENLENLLQKHFGDDWEWRYEDGYHPLMITSNTLSQLWEKELEGEC